jgi:hypothetical protein
MSILYFVLISISCSSFSFHGLAEEIKLSEWKQAVRIWAMMVPHIQNVRLESLLIN